MKEKIYLAALLHDIGKFSQRADNVNSGDSKILDTEIKKLEGVYCPFIKTSNSNGYYGYKHVLYTAQFFNDHIDKTENFPGIDKSGLLSLAAAHHKPSNIYETIIQKADHFSSGVDRTLEYGIKDAHDEQNFVEFRKKRMRSIFEGVFNDTYHNWLPINTLDLKSDKTFPHKSFGECPDYSAAWKAFEEEVIKVEKKDITVFSEVILQLIKKYASAVPSSTQHLTDVSLYDHLKSTASFAVCIYEVLKEEGFFDQNDSTSSLSLKPDAFKLIAGDISGIQQYIYGIIPRRAAKNLKGRSFYLHLLTDSIVSFILNELKLYEANVVYASGGSFYIIAPNSEYVRDKLDALTDQITASLFDENGIRLRVNIASADFGEKEIFDKQISAVWNSLIEELDNVKQRPFKTLIRKEHDRFFSTDGINEPADTPRDGLTGEPIFGKVLKLDDDIGVDENTYRQIKMGMNLRDADLWITSKEELTYLNQEYSQPANLGFYHYLLSKSQIKDKVNQLTSSADKVRSVLFNNADILNDQLKGSANRLGFDFYGGNKYPIDQFGEPLLFEELAGVRFSDRNKTVKVEPTPGLVRLGILRMDVDNLGAIFKEGFREDMRTFSRLSTLSRSLDYFFKGYLNVIWSETDLQTGDTRQEFSKYTQIIYSGGDDLFILGRWDLMPVMAHRIYKRFRDYTCHNPSLTLSGGLSVVPPKFPLLKAAVLAEKEESNAKRHYYGQAEKNAFSMFGMALNWEKEFPFILALKDKLLDLMANENLPKGFGAGILALSEQGEMKWNGEHYYPSNLEVIWLVAYDFSRAAKRTNSDKIKAFLSEWSGYIFSGKIPELKESKYHPLQILSIAARWADLLKRMVK